MKLVCAKAKGLDNAVCASRPVYVSSIVSLSLSYNVNQAAPTWVTLLYLTNVFLCQHHNRGWGLETECKRGSDDKDRNRELEGKD